MRKFFEPELVHFTIRKLSKDNEISNPINEVAFDEGKQIPIISDIERIKKIIQVVEFVGEKLGEIIDNKVEVPTSSPGEYYDEKKATEYVQDETTQ